MSFDKYPTITKQVCDNAPDNIKQECAGCIDRKTYTMTNTIAQLNVEKGATFEDADAPKACLADATYSKQKQQQSQQPRQPSQPQAKPPPYNPILEQVKIENSH